MVTHRENPVHYGVRNLYVKLDNSLDYYKRNNMFKTHLIEKVGGGDGRLRFRDIYRKQTLHISIHLNAKMVVVVVAI